MAPQVNASEAPTHPDTNLKIILRNENNLKNHPNKPSIPNRCTANNNQNFYTNNQIHDKDEKAPGFYKGIGLIQNLAEIFKQLPDLLTHLPKIKAEKGQTNKNYALIEQKHPLFTSINFIPTKAANRATPLHLPPADDKTASTYQHQLQPSALPSGSILLALPIDQSERSP
ncbi:hypothetical protein NPIL_286521 [Nephila pilipes]|uniref:Uncharacterized protein n=1 Tax=Nephila pilipes TaxID=299642 RepID=A0A8X6KFX7_NEPPI|nr:hypothetical protein NPIL_286521 [Nephila pilipes]